MTGNSGSQGAAGGFDRAEYERELTGLREALKGPDASAPTTAVELHELERLVRKYPDKALEFLDALHEPPRT